MSARVPPYTGTFGTMRIAKVNERTSDGLAAAAVPGVEIQFAIIREGDDADGILNFYRPGRKRADAQVRIPAELAGQIHDAIHASH